MTLKQHWDAAYRTRGAEGVSWFQRTPEVSLRLIEKHAADRTASIIDVGGGASTLTDRLLELGYADLTVLDVSPVALAVVRRRLAGAAEKVVFIAGDICNGVPARRFKVWHDRAAFHFIRNPVEQAAYVSVLRGATTPGSIVILATFALDGPERCSGLPVVRYTAPMLGDLLGPNFLLLGEERERHLTPAGVAQNFIYAVFERR